MYQLYDYAIQASMHEGMLPLPVAATCEAEPGKCDRSSALNGAIMLLCGIGMIEMMQQWSAAGAK